MNFNGGRRHHFQPYLYKIIGGRGVYLNTWVLNKIKLLQWLNTQNLNGSISIHGRFGFANHIIFIIIASIIIILLNLSTLPGTSDILDSFFSSSIFFYFWPVSLSTYIFVFLLALLTFSSLLLLFFPCYLVSSTFSVSFESGILFMLHPPLLFSHFCNYLFYS